MDKRFIKKEGFEVFNGNELIIKGALEAGVSLITGYPGSPVADVFDVASSIKELLLEEGVLAQLANNEALSVARLNGTQMEDIRAMAVMKSVGLHVAADGLAIGNLSKSGKKGGALVVVGDDPWSDSTQVPADSRYLAKHLHLPVMEPSTFQELKDWVKIGFELSRDSDLYLLYLVTTNQADGGGIVEVARHLSPKYNMNHPIELDTRKIPVNDTVLLPPRTGAREVDLKERYQRLHQACRERKVNTLLYPAQGIQEFGFISSGLAYSYLEHALWELGLQGRFPILKLGITFPIDSNVFLDFASQVKNVIVVEERRGFIEEAITLILKDAFQSGSFSRPPKIWGKSFPNGLPGIPSTRGLNPSILIERLGELFLHFPPEGLERLRVQKELDLIEEVSKFSLEIPVRTPTFCPGCPHRDSSNVLLDIKKDFRNPNYMKQHHKTQPVDLLFHGDTGCYTMLMFEPNQDLMHNYSGMGLGGGTGAGIDPFITNKQVVFMGDSTFFHSGMTAISDSIKNNQDIAYIILDNKTTAMTGHQPTPESDTDVLGRPTFAQDIEAVLRGMTRRGPIPVLRVNPAYREEYREVLEETILKEGVKVIIADKECGITFHRRLRKEKSKMIREKGYLPEEEFINITPEVCEYCLECTKSTGCPGLTVEETDYGSKIVTDLSTCVADMACTKIKACPSFEKVIVKRSKKTIDPLKGIDLKSFPQPQHGRVHDQWRTYISGVGGMGIGVLTSVLVHAGMREGYHVLFCDKKGLAIRNGGVYSEITFLKGPLKVSPLIPNGKADLLWGLDALEAARAIDPKMPIRVGSPERTTAFINLFKTPTIRTLMNIDHFSIAELETLLKTYTCRDQYEGFDFSSLSEKYLGSKLYSNLVMLGSAFQKGLLPLGLDSILSAIQDTIQGDLKKNITAFNLGRRFILSPEIFSSHSKHHPFQNLFEEKQEMLARTFRKGKRLSQGYRELVQGALTQLVLDDETLRHFALRVYDLIQYENLDYAKSYVNRVLSLYHKDRLEFNYAATKAVILYLAKVMLIKDEVYVAHLLTSPEKLGRDKERYHIDERLGDRVIYRHLNRPQFKIFGFNVEFDIVTRNWQLRIMKHLKFLRKILSEWHRPEKEFRQWYFEMTDRFDFHDESSYQLYVQALKTPEEVRGYRQIRYLKMEEARLKVSELLGMSSKVSSLTSKLPQMKETSKARK
ncbi:MAG: 2-oxoacid:acceptor oxidoreductase family protein [Chlamydiae bacterium]|nr:2-oxoacid:acceptor oxidoreductase family protein [Chlamydiota bacterium]MBI3278094.1 2-oxoacid:acceptor oxidoreductase family protein [Chlamydiota bacterium]